jgi:N-acylneuraminate cytidylyltransferase
MNIIALIPARSGSKGLKNKNILKLKGIPLIAHSIKFAKKLSKISKVFVSTDSEVIRQISIKYKAEAPFLRPKKYSGDNSKDIDVFKHFLKWHKLHHKKKIDLLIHFRPTSPFRNINEVSKAINIFIKNKYFDSLRCFKESDFSPYKMWKRSGNVARPLFFSHKKEYHSMGRQVLPKTYDHIGTIDILRPSRTIDKNSMVGKKTFFFLLSDTKNYIDIDKKSNLDLARKIKF